jgi:4-hydroxythreonine-4-phosphate dehydrogenase
MKFSGVSLSINVITGVNEYIDRPGLMNLIETGDLNIDVFKPGKFRGSAAGRPMTVLRKR